MIIPAETLVHYEHGGWVLYNVFVRSALAVEADGLALLQALSRGETPPPGPFKVWEIGWFSNEEGLLEDPTRVLRGDKWPAPLSLSAQELTDRLLRLCLLVEDKDAYLARFAPKTNLLDFKRFGNFHQQLGQHLLAVKRVNPGKWWCEQKFLDGAEGIRDGLYRSVEEARLDALFDAELAPGSRVVDLGCGVGYFSRKMAARGAEVIGVDPNVAYVDQAGQAAAAGSPRFVRAEIGSKPLDMLEDGWADLVFMSDALLFYFIPESPGQKADPAILLADIHRILKPGGRFLSLEPHAAFFLAPRLGDEDRPFTVLTEYRTRRFNIVPPLAETCATVLRHGFVLSRLEELYPAGPAMRDQRGERFAAEFPQWQLLEFRKVG